MRIENELFGDIAVFHLSGKLMGGSEATRFHGQLHEQFASGAKHAVVNLAEVDWMNSVGLGMLISALATAKRHGGELRLANITENIDSLLTITRLVTVFGTHDSVDEAVSALQKA